MLQKYRQLFAKYTGHKVWPSYYSVNAKILALVCAVSTGFFFSADVAIFSFFWAFALIDFTNMVILKRQESALKNRKALFKKCAIHLKEFDTLRKRMAILRLGFALVIPAISYFVFGSLTGSIFVLPICFMSVFILTVLTLPKFMKRAKAKGLITKPISATPSHWGIIGYNAAGIFVGPSYRTDYR